MDIGMDFESFSMTFHKRYAEDEIYLLKTIESDTSEKDFISNLELQSVKILHDAIHYGRKEIVHYMISKGTSLTKEEKFFKEFIDYEMDYMCRPWNALEISILAYTVYPEEGGKYEIFQLLRDLFLSVHWIHGLQPFHVACATGDTAKIQTHLTRFDEQKTSSVFLNKVIDAKSPVWPAMTPLMIAAKFGRKDAIAMLLDAGASPVHRDLGGNTALHYSATFNIYDERLFLKSTDIGDDDDDEKVKKNNVDVEEYNDEETYGDLSGMSHFLIACQFWPESEKLVRYYLKKGASPNAQMRQSSNLAFGLLEYEVGYAGLHIAGNLFRSATKKLSCPRLAKLLLEYGADVDAKACNRSVSPLESLYSGDLDEIDDVEKYTEFVCALIENGADIGDDFNDKFEVIKRRKETRMIFLRCAVKMSLLHRRKVYNTHERLREFSKKCLRKNDELEVTRFQRSCHSELKVLNELGLKRLLLQDDGRSNRLVKSDFNLRYGSYVDCSDCFSSIYPNYGDLLRIKLRNRWNDYEKKRDRVNRAENPLVRLCMQFCRLPSVCVVEILWNFTTEELQDFINNFGN